MVSSVNKSSLVSSLNASYQRLQQAQSRVEESQREVEKNRAALEHSSARLEKDKGSYSEEMSRTRKTEAGDLRYAVQSGSGTQQVKDTTDQAKEAVYTSKAFTPTPTVNTSGQKVGSTINTTA